MAKGTRARRAKRIAATYLGEFIEQCQQAEVERENFRRKWSGGFGYSTDRENGVQYITTPLGTHRDADVLGESNWSVIEPAMQAADSFGHVSEHAGVVQHTEGSCLNGWNESIVIRVDDAVALKEAMEFVDALQNYPVLDEDDYSGREYASNHPGGGECYVDNDCECSDGEHHRLNGNGDDGDKGCRAWLMGKLENQQGLDKQGWRGFEGSDVSEEHTDIDSLDPDYVASVLAMDNRDETYYTTSDDGTILVSWQWWCGADGCGMWHDATTNDLIQIKRHNLFNDIPLPAPMYTLDKSVPLQLDLPLGW